MITLADLRARNTLPSWQEAVAIVQELFHSTTVGRGAAPHIPDIEHIALSADGTIAALPGSPVPHDPVRHLAVVMDLASRRIVGWSMSDRLEAELVCQALRAASWRRQPAPGLIMHSDRGSQPRLNWSSQHRFGVQSVALH